MTARGRRTLAFALLAIYLILFALVMTLPVSAGATVPASFRPVAADVSPRLHAEIVRAASNYFGLDASPARLAAQIHQESAWNPRAQSPYAQGLAQFTPATAKWLPSVCPEVGPPDPWDETWSVRALACYDAWLHRRVKPVNRQAGVGACSRWTFALRAYNGGEKALLRERSAALAAKSDPDNWRSVEKFRARAAWAHRENIDYPRRILWRIEQAYLDAGWAGTRVCA